ncbi:hypothetical protein [Legionella clemsonensis]|uniref:Uncharacterized protein n=1 Tax=Legionella clemsonensis TaxID=1867846 RepID=A0A222P2L0_9GAMM|nr:hypothetical protein [Legionella clemsonensis]ASQ46061.1 hypothetical protein clem_07540 [Legionella clemsonensis]
MPISPGVNELFEQFIKSYRNLEDEFYPHLYPKLCAIHKEIKQHPEHYSDEALIARLASSAIALKLPPESGFSRCLRNFLIAYEKKINSLHILAEYNDDDYANIEPDTPAENPQVTASTSAFFKELQEAIRQRALRSEQKEKEVISIYPK